MKNRFVLFGLLTSMATCYPPRAKNQDELIQIELEKLPAATQTGANTMGAIVNGKAFLPGNSLVSSTPSYQCNNCTNGGYYLTVSGAYKSDEYLINMIDPSLLDRM